MGCHTWFYKKQDINLNYEQFRCEFIRDINEMIDLYERHISNYLDEYEIDIFEDREPDDSYQKIEILKRQRQMVQNGYCKCATMNKVARNMGYEFSYKTGLFYKNVTYKYHDLFRISDYPNVELLSLNDTLNFIKENEHSINWGVNGKENELINLNKFWYEYPDGRITFG